RPTDKNRVALPETRLSVAVPRLQTKRGSRRDYDAIEAIACGAHHHRAFPWLSNRRPPLVAIAAERLQKIARGVRFALTPRYPLQPLSGEYCYPTFSFPDTLRGCKAFVALPLPPSSSRFRTPSPRNRCRQRPRRSRMSRRFMATRSST